MNTLFFYATPENIDGWNQTSEIREITFELAGTLLPGITTFEVGDPLHRTYTVYDQAKLQHTLNECCPLKFKDQWWYKISSFYWGQGHSSQLFVSGNGNLMSTFDGFPTQGGHVEKVFHENLKQSSQRSMHS
jgi:hypothetical protein